MNERFEHKHLLNIHHMNAWNFLETLHINYLDEVA